MTRLPGEANAALAWDCPSCGHRSAAAPAGVAQWCSHCGEQRLPPSEPVWRSGARRWLITLRWLLLRPGALTTAWRDGHRKPFVAPLTLFLALNVLFFVSQSVSGLSMLSIPLKAHLGGPAYGQAALVRVDQRVAASGLGRDRWTERFDQRQQVLAKSTVLAMVPVFALAAAGLYARRGASWATHWHFALHFYALALLFIALLFPLLGGGLRVLSWQGVEPGSAELDRVATSLQALALGWYMSRSSARVYGLASPVRILLSVPAVTVAFCLMLLHRVAVFYATLLTT